MKAHQIRLHRQLGNTLTGLIIGLIIGLGIAVAVAMLITKSSTPFTNKGVRSADLPLTQLQDPNKPLYSNKDAAKDAAKELSKEQSAAAKAPETAPPEAVTKPTEVKPEIKASVEKPVQKTVEAGKADSPDDKYIYFLQAGAFKEQSDAESARAKLALIGFEARVSEKTSDTGSVYRVRIGPFSQVEAMNRMRAKLSENGVDVAIVRTVK